MRKIILISGLLVMSLPAHAGFMDMLGLGTKKEPATFAEACNTDDITAICPEMILGKMTMRDCLMENISKLSKQCATFVKKSAADKVNAAAAAMGVGASKSSDASGDASEKSAAVRDAGAAAVNAVRDAGTHVQVAADALKNLL